MNTLWSNTYAIWRLKCEVSLSPWSPYPIPLQAAQFGINSQNQPHLIYYGERLAHLPKIGIDVQSDSIVNAEFNQFFVNLKHSRDIRSRRHSYLGTAQQRGIDSWHWFLKASIDDAHWAIREFTISKHKRSSWIYEPHFDIYSSINARTRRRSSFFKHRSFVMSSTAWRFTTFQLKKVTHCFSKVMRQLKSESEYADLGRIRNLRN